MWKFRDRYKAKSWTILSSGSLDNFSVSFYTSSVIWIPSLAFTNITLVSSSLMFIFTMSPLKSSSYWIAVLWNLLIPEKSVWNWQHHPRGGGGNGEIQHHHSDSSTRISESCVFSSWPCVSSSPPSLMGYFIYLFMLQICIQEHWAHKPSEILMLMYFHVINELILIFMHINWFGKWWN